jgi:hypothetical protein
MLILGGSQGARGRLPMSCLPAVARLRGLKAPGMKRASARHRHHPLRRHRRHRHERHRRDAAQSRLRCRAPTSPKTPTPSARRAWACRCDRPRRAEKSRRRRGRRHLSAGEEGRQPGGVAARARGLPVVRRAEMLAELMRSNGRSPSAARTARPRPRRWSRAARRRRPRPHRHQRRHHQRLRHQRAARQGDWMVVEADESDGTFLKLPATIAVVTNIDPEHLDHYGSFALRKRPSRLRRRTSRSTASRCCASTIPRCRR